MRPLPLAACLALVTALPFATAAQEADPAPADAPPAAAAPAAATAGDVEHGRLLSYTCHGCHGITGYKNAYPSYKVPKIAGQSAEYLSQALHEYQQGKRKHPTMRAQAESFSAQDIADITAFLSTLK
ncbi:cytochrome C [Pseudoxanthomonas broegbernensis]|uniref:Cytochrome C n=1 Tax=Pseudoxanthomonas broegbernensis TaxID=83619 RepID=A0A7V8K8E3_9GAMM|nr:cytochrome c [Pseudoxanthomonas broegbernensis]KAF1688205.1 cytochrome C [Pseudoxanthomonas broegbernensis]